MAQCIGKDTEGSTLRTLSFLMLSQRCQRLHLQNGASFVQCRELSWPISPISTLPANGHVTSHALAHGLDPLVFVLGRHIGSLGCADHDEPTAFAEHLSNCFHRLRIRWYKPTPYVRRRRALLYGMQWCMKRNLAMFWFKGLKPER